MWQDEVMPKRPRDPNQLAKLVVDIATGEADEPDTAFCAVDLDRGNLKPDR